MGGERREGAEDPSPGCLAEGGGGRGERLVGDVSERGEPAGRGEGEAVAQQPAEEHLEGAYTPTFDPPHVCGHDLVEVVDGLLALPDE